MAFEEEQKAVSSCAPEGRRYSSKSKRKDTGWFLLHLRSGEDRRNHARLKVGSQAAASFSLRVLVAFGGPEHDYYRCLGRTRWTFLQNCRRYCLCYGGLQREL